METNTVSIQKHAGSIKEDLYLDLIDQKGLSTDEAWEVAERIYENAWKFIYKQHY